jgi:hypothetical protein
MAALGSVTLATPVLEQVLRTEGDNFISWSVSNTKVGSFSVQRQVDEGEWVTINTASSGTRSYTDDDAPDDFAYNYRVLANRGGRTPTASNEIELIVGTPGGGGGGGGGSELLTEADVTFIGGFKVPTSVGGWATANECPLAYRVGPGGIGRLLSVTHTNGGNRLYEMVIPSLALTSPYSTASVYRDWGNPYSGKRNHPLQSITPLLTNGLFWDDVDSRLYWNYGPYYDTHSDKTLPTLGYSTLDDNTGVATGVGSWGINNINNRITRGGTLRIPADFVAANCPGKPLLVGFGGMNWPQREGGSAGPAGWATVVPDINVNADRSDLTATKALHYPWNAAGAHYAAPIRARRIDTNYGAGVFGTAAAVSGSTITLDSNVKGAEVSGFNFTNKLCQITSGPGVGQERTLTLVGSTGRQYSVSPDWDPAITTASVYLLPEVNNNNCWEPSGGVGYWHYHDTIKGGAVWVDGTKKGVLFFTTFYINNEFYGSGGPRVQNCRHAIVAYDPDDLAGILAGDIDSSTVEPMAQWYIEFPVFTYPRNGSPDNVYIGGATWDAANRIIYVCVRAANNAGASFHPMVFAFQVAGEN